MKQYLLTGILILMQLFVSKDINAQALLKKTVTVSVSNASLGDVLKTIGKQGGFSFSYSNKAVVAKRLVSLTATSVTVEQALDQLLQGTCTYKQVGNHIVLQASSEKYYQVSGYVLDAESGMGIAEASVYERQQLVAAVTNNEGYFRLRLRHQYPTADLSISKERYRDTTVYFASVENKEYRLRVRQAIPYALDEVVVTDNPHRNFIDNFFSRLLLNSKLRAQTRNITSFIATRPVQTSFIPGIGTHGKLGAQVVNKLSLNVLGGYTAGVNGVELGGLFNINRGSMQFIQMAGLFNVVGGAMHGVQAGGLANSVQDTVEGVQMAGLINYAGGEVDGVQAAGIINMDRDSVNGVQVSGIANVSTKEMQGTQVSGIVNYARHIRGVQISLINLADTCEGIAIGLLNLSKNGYHKFSIYTDEIVPVNASIKTGNSALYTILFGGWNPGETNKVVSFGAGLGHQFRFSKGWSLTTEATVQHLYLGDWDHAHMLYRLRPTLCYQPFKWLELFTGPSFNVYYSDAKASAEGYLQVPSEKGIGSFTSNKNTNGWFGWQAGLSLF